MHVGAGAWACGWKQRRDKCSHVSKVPIGTVSIVVSPHTDRQCTTLAAPRPGGAGQLLPYPFFLDRSAGARCNLATRLHSMATVP